MQLNTFALILVCSFHWSDSINTRLQKDPHPARCSGITTITTCSIFSGLNPCNSNWWNSWVTKKGKWWLFFLSSHHRWSVSTVTADVTIHIYEPVCVALPGCDPAGTAGLETHLSLIPPTANLIPLKSGGLSNTEKCSTGLTSRGV